MKATPQAKTDLRAFLELARREPQKWIPEGPIARYRPAIPWPPEMRGAERERARQGKIPASLTIIERFLLRVDRGGPDECWQWQGSLDQKGYGRFASVLSNRAHQFAYELWVGLIPDGHQIDHVCHDPEVCHLGVHCLHRACANPRHLTAVPPAVNQARQSRITTARRAACGRGHPRGSEHWGLRANGQEYCRTCSMLRGRESRAKAVRV